MGFGVGLWLVQRFQLVTLLKQPIAPYLASTGGKLAVLSPTDPVMIVLKLGFITGVVLASPIIIYQIWAFLAPALYERERKAIMPALGFGLAPVSHRIGAGVLLPAAPGAASAVQLPVRGAGARHHLQRVLQFRAADRARDGDLVRVAAGDHPAGGGSVSSLRSELHRFRRFAMVLCMFAGAILSPGTDILSMIMMTVPLLLLYEVGFVGAWVIDRRRRRAAAAALILFVLFGAPARAAAQQPVPPPKPGRAARPALRAIRSRPTRPGSAPVRRWTPRRLGASASPPAPPTPSRPTIRPSPSCSSCPGTKSPGIDRIPRRSSPTNAASFSIAGP